MNNMKTKEYTKTYKKEIISNFITLINKDLTYTPFEANISNVKRDYKIANFNTKLFNRFYADDCIEGLLENKTLQDIEI